MALGYSASDNGTNNVFPSVRYVGRLASDPAGLMPHGEVTMIPGGNSQIANGSRWGDYSAMRVDPVDDCTFWYTQEYILAGNPFGAGNGGAWATQIGAFRFPSCNGTDLRITKTDSPDPVTAGNILTYSITVENDGPNAATNVTVTDVLPAGVTYLSDSDSCVQAPAGTLTCNLGTLASGADTVLTIQVRIPANFLSSQIPPVSTDNISNTASVASDDDDTNPTNDSVTISTAVNESADLRILKECKPDQPNKQPAGTPTFCDIYVDNLGPSDARSVVIRDVIISPQPVTVTAISSDSTAPPPATCPAPPPPATNIEIICNDAVLPAGARDTIKVTFVISDTGDVNDTATVSSATPDPDLSNNEAVGRVSFGSSADLRLLKTDSPDPVTAGTNITYTLTVFNDGPSTATDVIVKDDLPAQVTDVSVTSAGNTCNAGVPGDPLLPVTCNMGSIANGASEQITIVAKVKPDTPAGTILFNQARVTGSSADPDNSDNNQSAYTDVNTRADLGILKTADAAEYKPNTTITYRVRVTNNGPSDAQNVVVTDTLPESKQGIYLSDTGGCLFQAPKTLTCDLGTIATGTTKEFFIYFTVKGAKGDVINTAVVTSTTTDPGPALNTASVTVTIKGGVKP
jgi:uncharacterized repeat protein (TIGR01451 family)